VRGEGESFVDWAWSPLLLPSESRDPQLQLRWTRRKNKVNRGRLLDARRGERPGVGKLAFSFLFLPFLPFLGRPAFPKRATERVRIGKLMCCVVFFVCARGRRPGQQAGRFFPFPFFPLSEITSLPKPPPKPGLDESNGDLSTVGPKGSRKRVLFSGRRRNKPRAFFSFFSPLFLS